MMDFEVTDLGPTDHVAAGDVAPDFTRPLVNEEFWEDTALSDRTREGAVLLVFYPMDGSFVATYVWSELRDRAWHERYDVEVVGLSISTPYEHKTLIKERGMTFSLFSDPGNEVAEAYGVVHDLDGMAGVAEPRPAVFLVDEERTVEYAWVAREWPEFPDYDEIEGILPE